jgi:hypothetical protein
MDFQTFTRTKQEVINEVLSDCSAAETTLQELKNFVGTRMNANQIPNNLLDIKSLYEKAIMFYHQNVNGNTVTLNSEADSILNEAIKEGIKNG